MVSWILAVLTSLGCVGTSTSLAASRTPVIVVSMDTLRADHVGVIGGTTPSLTPNLDRLAREGTVFTNVYSQAATTALSPASLFTSRDPMELPQDGHHLRLGGELPTMAGILARYGWDTAAFVAGGELRPDTGVGEGFAAWNSTPTDFASLWHTFPAALAWLDVRDTFDTPYLLFVHGYDAHTRYLKPGPWGHLTADPTYAGPVRDLAWGDTTRVVAGRIQPSGAALENLYRNEPHPDVFGPSLMRSAAGAPLQPSDLAHLRHLYEGGVAWADTMRGMFLAELDERASSTKPWSSCCPTMVNSSASMASSTTAAAQATPRPMCRS